MNLKNPHRASPQDYLRQVAGHRTEEELQFSLGLYNDKIPGIITGSIEPLSEEEAKQIQEEKDAKKEGQEDQPQDSEEVAEEVTKRKRGRPKKSTEPTGE